MNAQEALHAFLNASLMKRKERYCDLITRPKGRKKFLGDLYHQLGDCFRTNVQANELIREQMEMPAFSYSETRGFGTAETSISTGLDALMPETGWLLIEGNGKFGIYQPEDMIDDRKYILV